MKLFLLGAPCAGKTTLMSPLRTTLTCPVLDMDEEIMRIDGGAWPSLKVKRTLANQVIDEASRHDYVVLAYSLLDGEQLGVLNDHGWVVCLLDLPEVVMRSRAEQRLASEGWTNIEWLPLHLRNIEDLRARNVFAHVLDAMSPTSLLVEAVLKILDGGSAPLIPAIH